ncbi:hypothetical protein FSB64_11975 [Paraburkholderia sp. JPY454]|uniref:Uncharacterized protein n=1 Tax=Paraburkholderia youngii TaxID=2782701 RepID=A0ABX2NJL2_9BURK|nr:hypothetical protein [Paraburkholderia youngii]
MDDRSNRRVLLPASLYELWLDEHTVYSCAYFEL